MTHTPAESLPDGTAEPISAGGGCRSVADMRVGECACLASCKDETLALLLSERGLSVGASLRLCWRAPLGDALCVEVLSSRFSLRRAEAQAMLLSDG